MKHFQYITANSNILNGKPCIKGTRISVSLILEWLASGANVSDITQKHPLLTNENVREAISYAFYTA
jgi:uncharacterized protein (DUF433 family)